MKHSDEQYILENVKKKSIDEIAKSLGIKKRKVERFLDGRKVEPVKTPALSANSKAPFTRVGILLAVLVIIALGVLTYSNSINGQFIWDDHGWIKNNEYVKDLSHPTKFFAPAMSSDRNFLTRMYRPVQKISYALEYSQWKLDVKGYHVTNIILHILVALAIFYLLSIITKDIILSSIAAMLFVVHPIHVEAVSYISGRSDTLGTVFLLGSLLLYILNLKNKGTKSIIVSAIMCFCYALALLSREASMILIALILLYHWVFRVSIKVKDVSIVFIMTAVYLVLRPNTFNEVINTTLIQRLPGFFAAFCGYIRLFFLPFDLHMEYGNKLFSFSDATVFLGILEFSALILLMFVARNRNKLIAFFLGWFIIALLPVANLYPVNAYMAEHWLYLPSIGLFSVFAWILSRSFTFKEYRVAAFVCVFSIICSYAGLTFKQNTYWQDPESFFKRNLEYSDYKPRLYNELGIVYYEKGEAKKAIEAFREGLRIDPRNKQIQDNLNKVSQL